MRKKPWAIWVLPLWFALCGSSLKANMVYPLKVFTSEGLYHDSPDLNLYIEVSNGGVNQTAALLGIGGLITLIRKRRFD